MKAFASDDYAKINQLTAEARATSSIETEIIAMQKVLNAPEFQESVESLLSMDRELKIIETYRVLMNGIAGLREITGNLPNVPSQWEHFFEKRIPLLSEIVTLAKEARPRFVGNIHHIQAIFENEVDKFESKSLDVVRSIEKQSIEVSQDQE